MPTATTVPATLAPELIEALGLFRRSLRRATAGPWLAGSLTGAQAELARLLRRRPGVSVNEAAEALALAPNTVSALVGQLVEAGMVQRTRDPSDGRIARLALSPTAQQRIEARRDHRAATLGAALTELDAADREALAAALDALGRLTEALDA